MAILRFNETEIARTIERLLPVSRAAFATACATRLLPAYAKFSTFTGKGNAEFLTEVLARLWRDLSGDLMPDPEIDVQISTCMKLIPQEEAGTWVLEQAAAEDAVSSLAYALRCRRDGLVDEAVWAAQCCYEALDHYVINHEKIDIGSPGAEEKVLAHPLVQAELARQQRDLDELLHGNITLSGLCERAKHEAWDFFRSSGEFR